LSQYQILFLGDVMGRPGRDAVRDRLPGLLARHQPLFTIVNGENSAGGVGITPAIAHDLWNLGADVITLGNHWLNKREIENLLKSHERIIRPGNMPEANPGRGMTKVTKEGVSLAVINLCGRVSMEPYDDPFREVDRLIEQAQTPHIFLDFHAEATSEKIAMGWHLEGRVTAVIGTHTHVATADERVLPGGTAYQTDAGMCGPENGVLGMDRAIILRRFLTGMHQKFEVADGPGVISGALIGVQRETGRAVSIERIRLEG
jgi:metallophosphoesterase (TIGR00282 family)